MSGQRQDVRAKVMTPQLRGMVVTTTQEGPATCTYVNITFIVPHVDAASVDLAQAFEDISVMVRQGKIQERPVALRREFIQPV